MAEGTKQAVDVVSIMNAETGEQVFAGARPLSASVFEDARAMQHPLEDGSSVVDHMIFLPVEIDMALRITDDVKTVFEEMRELFRSSTKLTVQTRTGTYDDQYITSLPADERGERAGSVDVDLRLKQAVFIEAQYAGAIAPVTRANAGSGRAASARTTTSSRGTQQTTAPSEEKKSQGSLLYRAFNRGGGS